MIKFVESIEGKVAFFSFVLLSAWWVIVQFPEFTDTHRQLFAAVYGVMALWGGLWGIKSAIQWGGLQSLFGKALLFFSVGLLLQEFGQLAYSYYIYYLSIEVPYPSLGDLGYFGSALFYIVAIWYLSKTVYVKFKKTSVVERLQIFTLPALMLFGSSFLFLQGYEFDFSTPLTIFLDFGYPLTQAITISLAILVYMLSRKMLGGMLKQKVILLIISLVVQYLADFMFLLQNSQGTWEVGRLNDYMYLIAYTCMTFSLMELGSVATKLKKNSS